MIQTRSNVALFLVVACSACGSSGTTSDAGPQDGSVSIDAPVGLADAAEAGIVAPPVQTSTWTVESGVRVTGVTSSCTLRLPDGTFRMYFGPSGPATAGPFRSATSSDGLSWSGPTDSALKAEAGEQVSNPSVVPLPSGGYMMLYEGTKDGVHRLYRATSTDGVTFTRTAGSLDRGAVMMPSSPDKNFLSVPDLIALPNGQLRAYFVAAEEHIESAISTDQGMTWTREGAIVLSGITNKFQVDPDVVAIPGGYWLFLAVPPGESLANHRIRSAVSVDGRTFTAEAGERVAVDDDKQIRYDPDVVATGDGRYRVYFGQQDGAPPNLRSAISPAK